MNSELNRQRAALDAFTADSRRGLSFEPAPNPGHSNSAALTAMLGTTVIRIANQPHNEIAPGAALETVQTIVGLPTEVPFHTDLIQITRDRFDDPGNSAVALEAALARLTSHATIGEAPKPPTTRTKNRLTVRKAFDELNKPALLEDQRAASTIAEYYSTIRHWERHGDLPVRQIDATALKMFFSRFRPPEYSLHTARKTWRHLRAILRRCGPETDTNPDGRGIIPRIPRVRIRRPPRKFPRLVSFAEIDALCHACRIATWPRIDGVPPAPFYRALIVALYNLGPRAWNELCMTPEKPTANVWQ